MSKFRNLPLIKQTTSSFRQMLMLLMPKTLLVFQLRQMMTLKPI